MATLRSIQAALGQFEWPASQPVGLPADCNHGAGGVCGRLQRRPCRRPFNARPSGDKQAAPTVPSRNFNAAPTQPARGDFRPLNYTWRGAARLGLALLCLARRRSGRPGSLGRRAE